MNSFMRLLLVILLSTHGFYALNQVVISQYIDTDSGTSPKGIEVYNHSSTSIDFSVENLEVYQGTNGSGCSLLLGATVNSGILQPGEVWVIGTTNLLNHASSNGNDLAGTTDFSFAFNGNDALELYLGGVKMDVLGTCGNDPGNAWSGNGVSTADQNIAIKSGYCSGTTTYWSDPSVRFNRIANGSNMTGFGDAPNCINNSITISSISSLTYTVDCNNTATGSVSFSSSGSFDPGNNFSVELSNETGAFNNYATIGTVSLDGMNPTGTINFTIPANTETGSAYRIRIGSDNPHINSADNGSDISIINTSPCATVVPEEGALLINEFSNGPSGSKEYYELVAIGKCGETIDVRGFIIDDNNGDFGSTAISNGHLRLTNDAQWSSLPVGAIIVIYNNNDKNNSLPADDLNDSNNDSVYIIPHDNATLLELYSDFPNNSNNTYSSASTPTSNWMPLQLGNSNDAIQTRFPNGDYFFGVSYGSSMNGGPDNTKLTNLSLKSKNGFFSSGDFRDVNNWEIGDVPAAETPGAANNTANQNWINMLRAVPGTDCNLTPLPITLVSFDGDYKNGEVQLNWKSATEKNNDYYEVFHSTTGYDFVSVGKVNGAGNSNSHLDYRFNHRNTNSGINYYQLKSVDYDGETYEKGIISVSINREMIFYDQHTQQLHFPNKGNYKVYSTTGKKVLEINNEKQTLFTEKGLFLIYNEKNGVVTKIMVN